MPSKSLSRWPYGAVALLLGAYIGARVPREGRRQDDAAPGEVDVADTTAETSIVDAMHTYEARKKAAGFYEDGELISDDQHRQSLIGLDLSMEEIDDAARDLGPVMQHQMSISLAHGYPPMMYLQGVWRDAFTLGVLYERKRNGQL